MLKAGDILYPLTVITTGVGPSYLSFEEKVVVVGLIMSCLTLVLQGFTIIMRQLRHLSEERRKVETHDANQKRLDAESAARIKSIEKVK